jgi:hypothetical protein
MRDEDGDPCCSSCWLSVELDGDATDALDENTERTRCAVDLMRACWHVDHGDC